MHERTLLLVGGCIAIIVVVSALLAPSRLTDWQRAIGHFLPGWPWW